MAWFPHYANIRALWHLKWRGANLFRAAMYADSDHHGYNENEVFKNFNLSMMYMDIENALAADMYVIGDWHLLCDQSPPAQVNAAVEFFSEISSRYASEPGLIYEIATNPAGTPPGKTFMIMPTRSARPFAKMRRGPLSWWARPNSPLMF